MVKIQYKYRKWDKEVKESTAVKAIELQYKNIQTTIDLYLNPEKFKEEVIRNLRICDPASFYDLLGGTYFLLANDMYLLESDTEASISYLYLYVKSLARSYELKLSGVTITRSAIERNHSQKRDLEQISFAAAIGRFELFEKYGDGIGCELISGFASQFRS